MLSEKFTNLANQIEDWQGHNIPQQLKAGLTRALRIAASHPQKEVLEHLLQKEQNAFGKQLAAQIERLTPAVINHMLEAIQDPDGAWQTWQRKFPIRASNRPAQVLKFVDTPPLEEKPTLGLERILGIVAGSMSPHVYREPHHLGII